MDFTYNWSIPDYIYLSLKDWVRYSVEEKQDTRTQQQNKILWGYYYEECLQAFKLKWIIINKDQVHFFCKTLIPKKKKKCKVTGKYRTEEISTTKLWKKEFSNYIEAIKIWCFDNLEYSIQNPTDDELLKYYDSII